MDTSNQKPAYTASITVLTGPHKGKHIKLAESKNFTIGRGAEMGIQLLDKGLSRCHAYLFHAAGKIQIEDLNSSNGTFVNKKRITKPIELKHGDKIFIGSSTLLLFTNRTKLSSTAQQRDIQTNLLNKKACLENIKRLCGDADSEAADFCVLIIKIDDFKNIISQFGREAADEVVVQYAKMLTKISRKQDYVCRFGSSEFAIVCPSLTSIDSINFAEFIRAKSEEISSFHSSLEIGVTVSIGIANYPADESQTEMQVITNAHDAMKHSEKKGKNCTSLATS